MKLYRSAALVSTLVAVLMHSHQAQATPVEAQSWDDLVLVDKHLSARATWLTYKERSAIKLEAELVNAWKSANIMDCQEHMRSQMCMFRPTLIAAIFSDRHEGELACVYGRTDYRKDKDGFPVIIHYTFSGLKSNITNDCAPTKEVLAAPKTAAY